MGRPRTYCQIDQCGDRAVGRQMCKKHWQRWRKWGDPRVVDSRWRQTEEERFWSYVNKTEACWPWSGRTKNGYGEFDISAGRGRTSTRQAHRYAYELAFGQIPDGITLDHVCHTAVAASCPKASKCPHRACVRPDHMEPMPLRENISIGGNGAKVECKRGHEFTPENTGSHGPEGRYRYCRTCKRADAARLRVRRRAT